MGKRLSSCCKCGKRNEAIHEMGKCPELFKTVDVKPKQEVQSKTNPPPSAHVVFKKPWEK